MNRISQNEYQKIVEENKKLLEDIKILTKEGLSFKKIQTIEKWRKALEKAKKLKSLIYDVLRPRYKRFKWEELEEVRDKKTGMINPMFEKDSFVGTCWLIESIENIEWLASENYTFLSPRSYPHQERPLPHATKFTKDTTKALKFRTKRTAEIFLAHYDHYIDDSSYIIPICEVTEHEFVNFILRKTQIN